MSKNVKFLIFSVIMFFIGTLVGKVLTQNNKIYAKHNNHREKIVKFSSKVKKSLILDKEEKKVIKIFQSEKEKCIQESGIDLPFIEKIITFVVSKVENNYVEIPWSTLSEELNIERETLMQIKKCNGKAKRNLSKENRKIFGKAIRTKMEINEIIQLYNGL